MNEELAIPATGFLTVNGAKLIDNISSAVGGFWEPFQIVRLAKAHAKEQEIKAIAKGAVDIIKEESKLAISEFQQRTAKRFFEEEQKKQLNMENIRDQAIPLLGENADPDKVEDDWMANFFDKCRITSDGEMQKVWAKILAGEATTAGTYSKKTVNILADLDKSDAIKFQQFCGLTWVIGDLTPMILNLGDDILKNHGIVFELLAHLESLGLIQLNLLGGYAREQLPRRFQITYFGQAIFLSFNKEDGNVVQTGKVLLTAAGRQLAKICNASRIEGFYEHVFDQLKSQGLNPSAQPW